MVVICWKISIFAPAKTTKNNLKTLNIMLWFAEKLVSLHQQKQLNLITTIINQVVICWKISIFAPAKTTKNWRHQQIKLLWFAEKLVSLHQQKQLFCYIYFANVGCDLLKN